MARILLVDDSCFNLHLLRTQLESAELEISEAVSGSMALGIAAEVLPDLVILDLVMPGIDGYET